MSNYMHFRESENQLILQNLLPQISFYFQEFIFQMLSNKEWKTNLIAVFVIILII